MFFLWNRLGEVEAVMSLHLSAADELRSTRRSGARRTGGG
jgi:hypothetical protein